jgi:hypothetical protein
VKKHLKRKTAKTQNKKTLENAMQYNYNIIAYCYFCNSKAELIKLTTTADTSTIIYNNKIQSKQTNKTSTINNDNKKFSNNKTTESNKNTNNLKKNSTATTMKEEEELQINRKEKNAMWCRNCDCFAIRCSVCQVSLKGFFFFFLN